ncbi:MAG TPA: MAPEG family protein [Rhizomicrobium sp.]|jgi:uncharacterized MAPEG superfamily protein|nr:MAPEG family protein [Rhizomicrobium sp.]
MDTTYSTELQMLFCAIALGIVQLLIAVLASVGARGMPWAAGPRDEPGAPIGKIGGRLERAYRNFLETFALFAAAVLLAHALDKTTAGSALGAQIYLWARVLYIPAYVFAIPFLRTLIWMASLVGIVMVMSAIWPG